MKAQTLPRAMCVLLSILALAACDPTPPASKLPQVKTEAATHPVIFDEGKTRIYRAESEALAEFIHAISPPSVTYIGLAADDTNRGALARARKIRDYLVAQGFSRKQIYLRPAPGSDPDVVLLIVRHNVAVSPQPCPDWSKNSITNYENTDSSDFGCAYNNDFVVQIANPGDYNAGSGKAKSDSMRDGAAVQRYLSGSSQLTAASSATGASGGNTSITTSSP